MIDFDKMFSDYVIAWHRANASKYTPAQIENMVDELYNTWADTPCDKLKNIAPRQFFKGISNAGNLIVLLKEYCCGTFSPPSLLLDEIVSRKACEPHLLDIVKKGEGSEVTTLAVNLLKEMGSTKLRRLVFEWVFDANINGELRELATEIVAEDASEFLEEALTRINTCDKYGKTLAMDFLVKLPYNEQVYKMLVELLLSGDNVPLYASYLGKYGNESAIDVLLSLAQDCNYLEYLEIRNAVEMLGGDFDVSRDFSEDRYYRALKGLDEFE